MGRLAKKLTIEDMQILAIERGGKCLSSEYINTKTPLKWECKYGHQWTATVSNIIYGKTWCPKCDPEKKLTIEEMQKIASEHNGKCLSLKYKNTRTKLEWECEHGHRWKSTPNNIRKGRWCPICGHKKHRK